MKLKVGQVVRLNVTGFNTEIDDRIRARIPVVGTITEVTRNAANEGRYVVKMQMHDKHPEITWLSGQQIMAYAVSPYSEIYNERR